MAKNVTSTHKGDTFTVILSTYDDDELRKNADGTDDATPAYPTLVIKKGETVYPAVIVSTEMVHTGLGEYKYYWDTTGLVTGAYNIDVDWDMDSLPHHKEIIRFVTD